MQYEWAQITVQTLVEQGVCFALFGSGYRLTPLLIAAHRHPDMQVFHQVDERGATYRALGWARATKRPALVLTTSGTASVNAFPALVEASLDRVPLLLITSDRPLDMLHCGHNQTMDQHHFFSSHVRHSEHIVMHDDDMDPNYLRATLSQSVRFTLTPLAGPVHINCSWREPLETGIDIRQSSVENRRSCRTVVLNPERVVLDDSVLSIFSKSNSQTQGVICAGGGLSAEDTRAILSLADRLCWPIFPDILSGLRLHPDKDTLIFHYDELLKEDFCLPSVDRIVCFGRRFVSNAIHSWISQHNLKHCVCVVDDRQRYDTHHRCTDFFLLKPQVFCEALLKQLELREVVNTEKQSLLSSLKDSDRAREQLFLQKSKQNPFSQQSLYRSIVSSLNKYSALFLSNSLAVRTMDRCAPRTDRCIPVASNRGVSGIDGILSTALGFSEGLACPLTLVVGDLAFLYDVNALLSVRDSSYPLCLVLMNNNGGGIFQNLAIANQLEEESFRRLYQTPHDCRFEGLCSTFSLPYFCVDETQNFETIYRESQNSDRSVVIEVEVQNT